MDFFYVSAWKFRTFKHKPIQIPDVDCKIVDFLVWIVQNLDLIFEKCWLLRVNLSKFGFRFWKLITFTYQFENYGLLWVNLFNLWTFEELWTFTGESFKMWTSFLKILDSFRKILDLNVWMPPIWIFPTVSFFWKLEVLWLFAGNVRIAFCYISKSNDRKVKFDLYMVNPNADRNSKTRWQFSHLPTSLPITNRMIHVNVSLLCQNPKNYAWTAQCASWKSYIFPN